MYEYKGLYVIMHIDSGEIQYQGREMMGDSLPSNCTSDILSCVHTCNSHIEEEYVGWKYIDMYGIVYEKETYLWEVIN